jgi:hypothetical protein
MGMVEKDAVQGWMAETEQPAADPAKLVALARHDRDQTERDVRHNKRAAQDSTKSAVEFQFAHFMARASDSLKLKGKGRRVKTADWTLAKVEG